MNTDRNVIRSRLTITLLFVLACSLPSCASGPMGTIFGTRERQAYLDRLSHEGSRVIVSKHNFDTAWNRAKWFTQTFSSFRVVTFGDSIIANRVPAFHPTGYWYSARVTRRTDSTVVIETFGSEGFLTKMWTGFQFAWPEKELVFADYIRTGELPYPDLVSK